MVAGCAGFLGTHLASRLLAQGHQVIGLDNFCSGSRANVDRLREFSNFTFIEQSVARPIHARVDQIYNLASPASPRDYMADPIETTKTNVLGALHILDLAVSQKARILQASTSEVYGDPLVHPQGEGYLGNVDPTGPRACYDEGKRCAESLCFDYARVHGVDVRVARIFNTYGPGMKADDGRVVSNFVMQALCGEDLTIYGSGSQTRSFCYVDDLVDGLMRLMNCPEKIGQPVNLGNPEELTIRELAETVLELTGSKSGVLLLPSTEDDPRRRRPDISLARNLLGWAPTVALRSGLLRTIEHFERSEARPRRPASDSADVGVL